jgi:hypothetical protein
MTVAGVAITQGQYICENLSFEKGSARLALEATNQVIRDRVDAKGYKYKGVNMCCGPYFLDVKDELSFSQELLSSAFEKYINDPFFTLKCTGINMFGFFCTGRSHMSTLLNSLIQIPFVILSAIGLFSLYRVKNEIVKVIALFIGYYIAIHLPILAFARHSIPLVPILSIFFVHGIVVSIRYMREKAGQNRATM